MREALLFFPYYGGKTSRSRYYPPPRHRVVIEPFAGSAGYSCSHWDHDVRLYDVDEKVIGTWRYLIRATAAEIRSLPAVVANLGDHRGLIQEAQWLIGWWLHRGSTYPRRRMSSWRKRFPAGGDFWGERVRDRLASRVERIRHWRAAIRSYHEVPDERATYFVDPPYSSRVGSHYTHRFTDHRRLGEWCRSRQGQVIVCEHLGADWLPFRPLGPTGPRDRRETVWTAE